MADINLTIDVVDQFSQRMDQFEQRLRALEGASGRADRNMARTERAISEVGGAASKSGGLLKGFGGAMFVVNLAMQALHKASELVKDSLNDVADQERAIIMLGPEAGQALSNFVKDSATAMGRSQSDVMRASLNFRRTGMGGDDIMEMTKLADRFANLNQKEYSEVAQTLNDAVKNKNVGGLAELLGGGEGVEKKLQRAGVERALRSGDVGGAMEKFKSVADGFGYTQDKADKMGMTIDRKIDRITNNIKNKFTNLFSGIVQRAEPYIDKVMNWLESDEVEIFFDNAGRAISSFIDTVVAAVDLITDVVGGLWDGFHEFYDGLLGESTTTTETLVGIFVGGFTAIGGYIYNAAAKLWDWLIEGTEELCNSILFLYNKMKDLMANKAKQGESTLLGATYLSSQRTVAIGLVNQALEQGDIAAANKYMEAAQDLHDAASSGREKAIELMKKGEFDFTGLEIDTIDVEQRVADNIKGVMDTINGFGIDRRDPERKKSNKILSGIHRDTSKIRGSMQHEQDLRWLKERAEQHAINEVNVRQLTPTINVRIEGGNITQRDVERGIQKVLEEQANAGTFNAYGEVA